MGKITIGYIFSERGLGEDERAFLEVAKKKNIDLVMINTSHDWDKETLQEKVKPCKILYNNCGENFSLEITKMIEEYGKKIIDSSKNFYYDEEKWMFFLKCQKHKIPVPKTILLSANIPLAKKELKNFNCWPVVLKRVEGTMAEYVEKAENLREAEKIINHFWKKGSERLPIIAQEFIKSQNYRVTVIGDKIVQTALKKSNRWKTIGNCAENFKKFKVDKELKVIINKIIKFFGIKVCGIDLLKKNRKWLVLEVNSIPAFDFFPNKRKELVGKVLDFLKKESR
ncbi:ATP-grasp domain-containing protein [Candidatus Pacearchaeota archaeon]|jgi:ribosomal protein S6--L-glutamate ligase|nr:ATP-grasp domain-containing protein [Candidatus Pacearchaeota archaeon]